MQTPGGVVVLAFYDDERKTWLALAAKPSDRACVVQPLATDLNETAQEHDVWLVARSAIALPAVQFYCVRRARGAYVWREYIPPPAPEPDDDDAPVEVTEGGA